MKQYRVSRVSIMEPYGSPWSALTTCVREFDTVEEALECINHFQILFPDSYIMNSGNLGRAVDWIHQKTFDGISFNIVTQGSVFWMVLEHGDGLPMPIEIH